MSRDEMGRQQLVVALLDSQWEPSPGSCGLAVWLGTAPKLRCHCRTDCGVPSGLMWTLSWLDSRLLGVAAFHSDDSMAGSSGDQSAHSRAGLAATAVVQGELGLSLGDRPAGTMLSERSCPTWVQTEARHCQVWSIPCGIAVNTD